MKDSFRLQAMDKHKGIRYKAIRLFDSASGWLVAAIVGSLTACVAYLVDIAVAIVIWTWQFCVKSERHKDSAN